jgi:hypothetical protein
MGYKPADDTWEPESHLLESIGSDLISAYHRGPSKRARAAGAKIGVSIS